MHCPYCSHNDSRVTDSRETEAAIRRRRECLECRRRFTTYERVQTARLMVSKRDGRREEFSRDKMISGLRLACAKRPVTARSIERMVDEIESEFQQNGSGEVSSDSLGTAVMDRLAELDRVAYIRFASVYRDFRDLESFREEINSLLDPPVDAAPANQLSFLEGEALSSAPRRRGRGRPKKPPARPA